MIAALLFILLASNNKKNSLQGKLIYIYFLCYSVLRFFDEFLRGDIARGFIGFLSVSQTISLFFCVVSFIGLLYQKEKNNIDS